MNKFLLWIGIIVAILSLGSLYLRVNGLILTILGLIAILAFVCAALKK